MDNFWSTSEDELLHKLEASRDGLTSIEARQKLDIFGLNTIKKMSDFFFLLIKLEIL
ncbi:MAG: hypothetical protein IH631_03925 [Candidatus Thorarchaeota archaeon]|nr:hypothetical protein [Candidatus Thorarchaeota archaeon]